MRETSPLHIIFLSFKWSVLRQRRGLILPHCLSFYYHPDKARVNGSSVLSVLLINLILFYNYTFLKLKMWFEVQKKRAICDTHVSRARVMCSCQDYVFVRENKVLVISG